MLEELRTMRRVTVALDPPYDVVVGAGALAELAATARRDAGASRS